ncbi:MAG: hypothetical protein OFPII_15200 [Osedax symbiont Rs1]|nr:MAG: hypothetical protein OFPII_15200 [Osedax symbiont Rs1]
MQISLAFLNKRVLGFFVSEISGSESQRLISPLISDWLR